MTEQSKTINDFLRERTQTPLQRARGKKDPDPSEDANEETESINDRIRRLGHKSSWRDQATKKDDGDAA